MMYGLLCVVSLALFGFSFYEFVQSYSTLWMVLGILAIVGAVVFGGLFLSGRVNKKEDIHITE